MTHDADAHERFRALIERHRGIVLKVAATYAPSAHDREDLAQEIAAELWRAFPGYDAARPFSTWMYRVALNVAISHRRAGARHAARTEPFDEAAHESAADADYEVAEPARVLERFVASLDPFNRALLVLYLDERSQREIADVLGISETNVSTKIGRLKQRLRAFAAPQS